MKYKIIIPSEEPKQEKQETHEYSLLQHIKFCLECKNESQAIRLIEQYGFDKQEQNKKMYSEEEVRNIVEQTIEKFYKHRYVETKSEMKELWFQQFKKK